MATDSRGKRPTPMAAAAAQLFDDVAADERPRVIIELAGDSEEESGGLAADLCAAVRARAPCGCGAGDDFPASLIAFDARYDERERLHASVNSCARTDNLLLFLGRAHATRATLDDLKPILGAARLSRCLFLLRCSLLHAESTSCAVRALLGDIAPYARCHGLLLAARYDARQAGLSALSALLGEAAASAHLTLHTVFGHLHDDTVLLYLKDMRAENAPVAGNTQQYVEQWLTNSFSPFAQTHSLNYVRASKEMEMNKLIQEEQSRAVDAASQQLEYLSNYNFNDQDAVDLFPIVQTGEIVDSMKHKSVGFMPIGQHQSAVDIRLRRTLGIPTDEELEDDFNLLSLLDSSGISELLAQLNQEFGTQLMMLDIITQYSEYYALVEFLESIYVEEETFEIDAIYEENQMQAIASSIWNEDVILETNASQMRMLLMHQMAQDTNYHLNVIFVLKIQGIYDQTTMERSFSRLLVTQEGMRIVFELIDEGACQVVQCSTECSVKLTSLFDMLGMRLHTEWHYVHSIMSPGMSPFRIFDLLTPPSGGHQLLINVHHILCDGYGLNVLFSNLLQSYNLNISGLTAETFNDRTFENYLEQEKSADEDYSSQLKHWQGVLRNAEDLNLVTDMTGSGDFRRSLILFSVDEKLLNSLHQLSGAQGTTSFINCLAALSLCLHRFTGQLDLSIGYPVDSRDSAASRDVIACMINTAVARVLLHGAFTVSHLLTLARALVIRDFSSRGVPFEKVVRALGASAQPGRSPLFQVLLNLFPQMATSNCRAVHLALQHEQLYSAGVLDLDHSLTLFLNQRPALSLWEYNGLLYQRKTAARLILTFVRCLQSLLACHSDIQQLCLGAKLGPPQALCAGSRIFDTANVLKMETVGKFTGESPFTNVWKQNWKTPTTFQLKCGLDYETIANFCHISLMKRSIILQFSYADRGQATSSDSFLCVNAPRQIDFFSSALAVVSSGMAYSPIDPNYPDERKQYILSSCRAAKVLGPEDFDFNKTPLRKFHSNHTFCDVDVAYAIFTSGSTGRPKGVCVPHFALGNTCHSVTTRMVSVYNECVFYQCVSLVFDVSLIDIGSALCHGGTLSLALNPLIAEHEMAEQQATTSHFAAAIFSRMSSDAAELWAQTECMTASGETALASTATASLEMGLKLMNMFGPTETTIFSTGRVIRMLDDVANIGTALSGELGHSLDKSLNSPPVNAEGELFIGGSTMARGYLNVAHKTEVAFKIFSPSGGRMYATEDIVRLTADGDFKYIGRRDFQIKMFGYRVELAEIEAVLVSVPKVQQCVVLKIDSSLVAFLRSAADPNQVLTDAAAATKQQLATFMRPTDVIVLQSFPLGFTGKVDRTKLTDVFRTEDKPTDVQEQGDHIIDGETVADTSSVPLQSSETISKDVSSYETALQRVWSAVLKTDTVGVTENFFDLGGSSVLILQIVAKCERELQVKLTANDVFTYPTIRALAGHVFSKKHGVVRKTGSAGMQKPSATPKISMQSSVKITPESHIAILAVSGQFSGSATVVEYWENIFSGRDCISREPDNPATGYIGAMGQLSEIEYFDNSFWNMTLRDARLMDPQARKFLEESYHALQQTNSILDLSEHVTAVVAGCGHSSYAHEIGKSGMSPSELWLVQELNSLHNVPTRVSYLLNLNGPAFGVDTACSTSLVAVHLACKTISRGECSAALVGAAAFQMPHAKGYIYEPGMIFSSDGHCRTFDKTASGTVLGAGCSTAVLMRLRADFCSQSRILGIIAGSASNNDGNAKVGFTAPSVTGQTQCIQAAHKAASIDAAQVSYVECHGTGTPLGDPIEMAALSEAFSDTAAEGSCILGAVKANIGHADTAAGMAGFTKAVGILHYAAVPPQINFTELNPELEGSMLPFRIETARKSYFETSKRAYIGISSFGIGGTNGHVVLKRAPLLEFKRQKPQNEPGDPIPMLISAKSAASCAAFQAALAIYCRGKGNSALRDVSVRLSRTREYKYRVGFQAKDGDELELQSERFGTAREAKLAIHEKHSAVFMFPGQGAITLNAGRDTYDRQNLFRQQLDSCFNLLESKSGVHVKNILFSDTNDRCAMGLLVQTEWAQSLHFALICAVVQQLSMWGIEPSAYVGHSLGETCCYLLQGGVDELADAFDVIYTRARLMQKTPKGQMVATSMQGYDALSAVRRKHTHKASISGGFVTISGHKDSIEKILRRLSVVATPTYLVPTSHAFHSHLIEPALSPLKEQFALKLLQTLSAPCAVNVHGHIFTTSNDTFANPSYWCAQARFPVQLSSCVETTAAATENAIFIEVGPGRSLAAMSKRHCGDIPTVLTMHKHKDYTEPVANDTLAQAICDIWAAGYALDLKRILPSSEGCNMIGFPQYQFDRTFCWVEEKEDEVVQVTEDMLYIYRVMWECVDLPRLSPNSCERQTIIVFSDVSGQTRALLEKLGDIHVSVFVEPDPSFSEFNVNVDALPPTITFDALDTTYYETLAQWLNKQEVKPDIVIHGWLLTRKSDLAAIHGVEKLTFWQFMGLHSLYALQQNILAGLSSPTVLTVLANGICPVAGKVEPAKHSALGLVRAAAREMPWIKPACIDIGSPRDWDQPGFAELATKALFHSLPISQSKSFAICRNKLWELQFVKLDQEQRPVREVTESTSSSATTALITGALGHVALCLAAEIAHTPNSCIVLVSRSILEQHFEAANGAPKQLMNKVWALLALGSKIESIVCDVTNKQDVRSLVKRCRRRHKKLDLIIHGAAALPSLNYPKSAEEMQNVLMPKVNGTVTLLRAIEKYRFPISVLAMTSSISAMAPIKGQADYAAANAAEDAIAYTEGLNYVGRVVSVNMGGWQFGMISKWLDIKRQQKAHSGAKLDRSVLDYEKGMNEVEGRKAFFKAISLERTRQVVVSKEPIESEQQVAGDGDAPAPEDKTTAVSRDVVRALFCKVLGVDQIDDDKSIMDLGVDSMNGIMLLNQLQRKFNCKIDLNDLLTLNSVSRICDYLTVSSDYKPAAQAVVPLSDHDSSKPPILFFHPVGGCLFQARTLANMLSKKYSYYGVQFPWTFNLENVPTEIDSLPALVSRYMADVRAWLGDDKSYVLIGHSMGGTLAYELARQLAETTNSTVKMVVMFDTWAQYLDYKFDEDDFKRMQMRNTTERMSKDYDDLDTSATMKIITSIVDTSSFLMKLLLRYHPPASTMCVHNFKAIFDDELHAREGKENAGANANYWNTVTPNLHIYRARGDHQTLLDEEHLPTIAAKINDILRQADPHL